MKKYISYVLKFSCDEILLKSSKQDSLTINFEKEVNIKFIGQWIIFRMQNVHTDICREYV